MAQVALAHKVTNSPINGSQPPPFSIGGLEKVFDTIFEREEVMTLR